MSQMAAFKPEIERILKSEMPTLACDFDGTITYIDHPDGRHVEWPHIGDLRPGFVKCFHYARALGFKWSLNTLRHGKPLIDALNMLDEEDIVFDTVNDNHWYLNHKYGECRKIAGDLYFEDRNFPPQDMDAVWSSFEEFLTQYGLSKK